MRGFEDVWAKVSIMAIPNDISRLEPLIRRMVVLKPLKRKTFEERTSKGNSNGIPYSVK